MFLVVFCVNFLQTVCVYTKHVCGSKTRAETRAETREETREEAKGTACTLAK